MLRKRRPTPSKKEPVIYSVGRITTPVHPGIWKVNVQQEISAWTRQWTSIRRACDRRLDGCIELPHVPNHSVGIEIEAERCSGLGDRTWPSNVWSIKQDGSLRNHGVEFISPAIQTEECREMLGFLFGYLDHLGVEPDFSWRTSIHVHLDVTSLSVEEFRNFLLTYFVFEDCLFEFANPGRRETNIFCTPINRANFYALSEFISSENQLPLLRESLASLAREVKKYSALNLLHLWDFGTVEFRHLRGTDDLPFLCRWIDLLLKLLTFSKETNKDTLYQFIERLNTNSAYSEFAEAVFGDAAEKCLKFPLSTQMLERGVSLAKEIIHGNRLVKELSVSPSSGLMGFYRLQEKKKQTDRLQKRASNKGATW